VGRRSAQTAIYRIASALVRLIAPTLVFTAEEVWKYLPREASAPESVHMAVFPEAGPLENTFDEERSNNWERLLSLREAVLLDLEARRKSKEISAALEAKVIIRARGKDLELLRKYAAWLPSLFITSHGQVDVLPADYPTQPDSPSPTYYIEVKRADGKKCERCWNYSTHVGESADYPTLCERCVATLGEIGPSDVPEAVKS
jgi:isoleucyl-tRNA synthetase